MNAGRAFTLVELLVVMAVLSVLGLAVLPMAEVASHRQREQELRTALVEIRAALDAHKRAADTGRIERADGESGYPRSLESLVEGVADLKTPGQRLYFLRRIPRDPFAVTGLPAQQTWGVGAD